MNAHTMLLGLAALTLGLLASQPAGAEHKMTSGKMGSSTPSKSAIKKGTGHSPIMAGDKMSKGKMSGGSMSGGKMAPAAAGGKMSAGKMTGDKMSGNKMSGNKMSGGKVSGDKMKDVGKGKM